MDANKYAPFLSLFIALALAIVCGSHVYDSKLATNGDNVSYFLLGRSLAQGHGYTEIWDVKQAPHTHFPPGYPFLIALFGPFFGDDEMANVQILKRANQVLFLVLLFLLFILARKTDFSLPALSVLLVLCGVNGYLLRFSHILMSEMPFLVTVVGALLVLSCLDTGKPATKNPQLLILILLLAAAFYLRTQALALVFAVTVFFLVHRKPAYLFATLIGFAVLTVPWQIRTSLHQPGKDSYVAQLLQEHPYALDEGQAGLGSIVKRFLINARGYLSLAMPDALFPAWADALRSLPWLGWVLSFALLALAGLGAWFLQGPGIFLSAYLVGTLGIVLLWPNVWSGPRFLVGIIPILYLLALAGTGKLLARIRAAPSWMWLLLLVPLFSHFPRLVSMRGESRAPYPPNWANYLALARKVKDKTPENAVVSCRKQGFFFLYSGRATCNYLFTKDELALMEDMIHRGADYVVVEQLGFGTTPLYLVPAIQKNPATFKESFRLPHPDTYLFEIRLPKDYANRMKALAVAFNVRGLDHFLSGKPGPARPLFEKSMKLIQRNMGNRDLELAQVISNLAVLHMSESKWNKARTYLNHSLSIQSSLLPHDHPELASNLSNLGEVFLREESFASAESLYYRALRIRREALGDAHDHTALSYRDLGRVYLRSRQFGKADTCFMTGFGIMEKLHGLKHPAMRSILEDAAEAYDAAGRPGVANNIRRRISSSGQSPPARK